jgi:Mismatch repair ATPase (MutS family)
VEEQTRDDQPVRLAVYLLNRLPAPLVWSLYKASGEPVSFGQTAPQHTELVLTRSLADHPLPWTMSALIGWPRPNRLPVSRCLEASIKERHLRMLPFAHPQSGEPGYWLPFDLGLTMDGPEPVKTSQEAVDQAAPTKKQVKRSEYALEMPKVEQAFRVVDLHAEALGDRAQNLPPLELMELQVKVFRDELDEAIAFGEPEITFIHGHGSGKLKDRLHRILRTLPEVKAYRLRPESPYQNGATRIWLS